MGLFECMTYSKMYSIGRNSTCVVVYKNQYVTIFSPLHVVKAFDLILDLQILEHSCIT